MNNTKSLRFVRANVSQQMFPSLPTVGNMTTHRQETMFPQQRFLVCPGLYGCEGNMAFVDRNEANATKKMTIRLRVWQ